MIVQEKNWYMPGTLFGWFDLPSFHYQLCKLITEKLERIPPPVERLKELTERNIEKAKSPPPHIELPEKIPSNIIQTVFGNELMLYGYDISEGKRKLSISPTWIAITDIKRAVDKEDYIAELSLSNEWGSIVFNKDFSIQAESEWREGEIVQESYTIYFPHLPKGKYGINIAVYNEWRQEEEEDHELHTVFKMRLRVKHLEKGEKLEERRTRIGVLNVK